MALTFFSELSAALSASRTVTCRCDTLFFKRAALDSLFCRPDAHAQPGPRRHKGGREGCASRRGENLVPLDCPFVGLDPILHHRLFLRTEQMHELVAGATASFCLLGGRTGARACCGEDPVDAGDLVLEHPDVAQQLLRPVVEAIRLCMRCNATLLTAVPRASQQNSHAR
jgi:hypothetical protein